MSEASRSPAPEPDASRFQTRELSWLEFNRRVLALAQDPSLPLLERVKFLAIFSGNLDEFFQVRVALLHAEYESRVKVTSPDGPHPRGAAGRDPRAHARAVGRRAGALPQGAAAGAGQGGRFDRRLERPRPRRPRPPGQGLRRPDLPGADAARGRPGPSLPLRLEPVLQPGGAGTRPAHPERALRAHQGAAAPRALPAAAARSLRADRAGDRGAPRPALPRDGDRLALSVPRHARRRPRHRGGRHREPPGRDRARDRAAPAPGPTPRAWRSTSRCRPARATCWWPSSSSTPTTSTCATPCSTWARCGSSTSSTVPT